MFKAHDFSKPHWIK